MSETNKPAVVDDWAEGREWKPDDPRWAEPPQYSDEKFIARYDRARCPIIPQGEYVVLRIDELPFLSLSGVQLALENQRPGAHGAHAPLLTIVAVGPCVEQYNPGDIVLTHPNNSELTIEWADPRPPHGSMTFILMKADLIIARYDHGVVEQMKLRAKYWAKIHAERAAEREKEEKTRQSEMNPFKPKEVLDATGQPVSKTGYHDE